MDWKNALTEKDGKEKQKLMLYINQKLENMLGIRIVKEEQKGRCKNYIIKKCFSNY